MDFHGKSAIVTGASIGIGRATAEQLAKYGCGVTLVDVDADRLNELADRLRADGADILVCVCDVSDEARVNEVVKEATEHFGKVDIMVNNAGIWRRWMPFLETTSDMWKHYIDVNILGTMYFAHAVLGQMVERGYGRIINVASVAGVYGNANMADYSMTKGAILSFTYGLAREAAEHGVAVNCVSPGNIGSKPGDGGESLSYLARRGTPEECANVICFLASDEASYVSGVNYTVDGCRKKI